MDHLASLISLVIGEIQAALLINIVFFVLGIVVGASYNKNFKIKITGSGLVQFVIVALWSFSMVMDPLNAAYEPPLALHVMMGAVVGVINPKIGLFFMEIWQTIYPSKDKGNKK